MLSLVWMKLTDLVPGNSAKPTPPWGLFSGTIRQGRPSPPPSAPQPPCRGRDCLAYDGAVAYRDPDDCEGATDNAELIQGIYLWEAVLRGSAAALSDEIGGAQVNAN